MFPASYFPKTYFTGNYFPPVEEGTPVDPSGPLCFKTVRVFIPGIVSQEGYIPGSYSSRVFIPGATQTGKGCDCNEQC